MGKTFKLQPKVAVWPCTGIMLCGREPGDSEYSDGECVLVADDRMADEVLKALPDGGDTGDPYFRLEIRTRQRSDKAPMTDLDKAVKAVSAILEEAGVGEEDEGEDEDE
jgi:hypothetical protein